MSKSCFILVFMAVAVCSSATDVLLDDVEPGKWTMNYDAAVESARQNDLALLLDFLSERLSGIPGQPTSAYSKSTISVEKPWRNPFLGFDWRLPKSIFHAVHQNAGEPKTPAEC